jgi:predicted CoA-substrate-specific enzyme activase
MITAGIDAGLGYTKVVILKDGKIIGRGKGITGGVKRPANIQAVYDAALKDAGIAAEDVAKVVATGKGKYDIPFANDRITEVVTSAKAAKALCPEATTVVSVGADETLVATLEGEKINEFCLNQKCAAGLGLFLEYMARRLGMTVEELSALGAPGEAVVNDGCVVFAELDALSLLNRGVDAKEAAKAVTEAVAWRTSTTINDITAQNKTCVVLFGGLTKNAAFLNALKRISGIPFVVPAEAEYAGALGAALIAAA